MTAPLTERLEAWTDVDGPTRALLGEAKAALEGHGAEVEAYTALLEAAEARMVTLTGALGAVCDLADAHLSDLRMDTPEDQRVSDKLRAMIQGIRDHALAGTDGGAQWVAAMLDPDVACEHRETYFSRVVCACGGLHDYCTSCGKAFVCPLDEAAR